MRRCKFCGKFISLKHHSCNIKWTKKKIIDNLKEFYKVHKKVTYSLLKERNCILLSASIYHFKTFKTLDRSINSIYQRKLNIKGGENNGIIC